METKQLVQRDIEEKWAVEYHKNTSIHRAGLALPPGNWERFDPFLLMAEDYMKKGAFDYHPHRGIETVTYMIDGELKHTDNRGGKGTLKKGDTQWMSAGKGLLHLEEAPESGFAHLLQLWVNLPAKDKMVEPRYQDITSSSMPVRKEDGAEIRVISGASGDVKSSTLNYAPVTMIEITLQPGRQISQDLPADYNGFLFVLEGSGVFGKSETPGKSKEILWLSTSEDERSQITIRANDSLKVLLIAGKPLREPVVARGPFVMNTEEQIQQAYKDFRDGKFGEWILQN